jgi:hypothetical protein
MSLPLVREGTIVFFETSEDTYAITQHRVPDLNPFLPYRCFNFLELLFVMNFSIFWVITRRELKPTLRDYLSLPSLRVSMSPSWIFLPLNVGPINNSETSVSNHLTQRDNPKTEEFILTAAKSYDPCICF